MKETTTTERPEASKLDPRDVLASSLAMFQEILEARATVREGSKAERTALHNKMCDALDFLYKGRRALDELLWK